MEYIASALELEMVVTSHEPPAAASSSGETPANQINIPLTDARTTAPTEHQPPVELSTATVKELKELIARAGLSHEGCVTKDDLRQTAAEAVRKQSAGLAAPSPSADADTTENEEEMEYLISLISSAGLSHADCLQKPAQHRTAALRRRAAEARRVLREEEAEVTASIAEAQRVLREEEAERLRQMPAEERRAYDERVRQEEAAASAREAERARQKEKARRTEEMAKHCGVYQFEGPVATFARQIQRHTDEWCHSGYNPCGDAFHSAARELTILEVRHSWNDSRWGRFDTNGRGWVLLSGYDNASKGDCMPRDSRSHEAATWQQLCERWTPLWPRAGDYAPRGSGFYPATNKDEMAGYSYDRAHFCQLWRRVAPLLAGVVACEDESMLGPATAAPPSSVEVSCFTADSCVEACVRRADGGVRMVPRRMDELREGEVVRTGATAAGRRLRRVQRMWVSQLPGGAADVVTLASGCRLTANHPVLVCGEWQRAAELGLAARERMQQVFGVELEGHVDTLRVGGLVCAAIGVYCGPRFGWNVFTRKTGRCDRQPCRRCDVAVVPDIDFAHIREGDLVDEYEPY